MKKLFSLMPEEILNETLEKIEPNTTNEEKIKALKTILEKHKSVAQQKISLKLDEKEINPKDKSHFGGVKEEPKLNLCFFCKGPCTTEKHIKEYGIFGCSELLKLSLDQMREAIVKKKICLNCGFARVT